MEPKLPVEELADLEAAPRRSPVLHWGAFGLAVLSLAVLAMWLLGPRGTVPEALLWLDVGLSLVFVAEFLTRSGLRWKGGVWYVLAHLFDFLAMAPALALVGRGLAYEEWWLAFILLARATRAVDRALGDGWVKKQFLQLLEVFEEELADRVTLRILKNVETDLANGRFGQALGDALERNKPAMLARIRSHRPFEGLPGELARISGIDKAIEDAEERAFDALVDVARSPELDAALRDVVHESFQNLRTQVAVKQWRQKRPRP